MVSADMAIVDHRDDMAGDDMIIRDGNLTSLLSALPASAARG